MKQLKYRKPNPTHLLWALSFLKAYHKEDEHAADVGKEAKTFRKWAWFYVKGIAALVPRVVSECFLYLLIFIYSHTCYLSNFVQIQLNRRFIGDGGELCLLTVDGTDFRIQEPWPFEEEYNRKWCSHKFKAAGVRYELGISLRTGDICWFNGPYPAGMSDITIFCRGLKHKLGVREKVVADFGYRGDKNKVCLPDDKVVGHDNRVAMCKGRGRHEAINGKLKRWGCLRQIFRHSRLKHHFVFKACLTLTPLLLDYGECLFDDKNYDAIGYLDE